MTVLRIGCGLIVGIVGVGLAASNPTRTTSGAGVQAPDGASPNRSYSLKLRSFAIPPFPATGLLLKARIDGGPQLRLLLDSGADSIVLDKRAAARSGHSRGSGLDLVGLGESTRTACRTVARTVEIGDLVLRDRGVVIVSDKVLDGIDGVIPLSLFAGFLVHLDIPGKTLDLQPYPPGGGTQDAGMLRVRGSNNLLFVRAVLNDTREGYVLLDTGAFYSAISEATARHLGSPGLFADSVLLQGGSGTVEGRMLSSGVRFRLGSQVVETNQVVVVGLEQLQRYHQMDVEGVVGYPALRGSVLTVNYRDGLVGIERK